MMQVLEPCLESVFGTNKNLQAGQLHEAKAIYLSFPTLMTFTEHRLINGGCKLIPPLTTLQLLPDSLDDLLLPLSQETAADLFVIGTQESTPSRFVTPS